MWEGSHNQLLYSGFSLRSWCTSWCHIKQTTTRKGKAGKAATAPATWTGCRLMKFRSVSIDCTVPVMGGRS